jgi:flagellar motor switch protein FliG
MFEIKVADPSNTFEVRTTENRGHTPEEVAELCVNRLISIGDDSHPVLQAQARAFRDRMLAVVTHYIKMGIEQDRATISTELTKAGYQQIADQLRRL